MPLMGLSDYTSPLVLCSVVVALSTVYLFRPSNSFKKLPSSRRTSKSNNRTPTSLIKHTPAPDTPTSPTTSNRPVIEVCVSDIESACSAWRGGATSIELCANRLEGGITPSVGLVEECVTRFQAQGLFEVHVLIRPRPGDFHYTDSEFDVILRDVTMVEHLGASGVVIGLLDDKGEVDKERMRVIRKILGEGMQLTFHRAFDMCVDSTSCLRDVIDIGCDRLLTSGCAPTAVEGALLLKDLVRRADGKLRVIAASGVTPDNVGLVIETSGVTGVHAGSCVCVRKYHQVGTKGDRNNRSATVSFLSDVLESEFVQWEQASEEGVLKLVDASQAAWVAVNVTTLDDMYA